MIKKSRLVQLPDGENSWVGVPADDSNFDNQIEGGVELKEVKVHDYEIWPYERGPTYNKWLKEKVLKYYGIFSRGKWAKEIEDDRDNGC